MKKVLKKSISYFCLSSMAFVMSYSLTACSSDEKPFVDNEPVAVKDTGESDLVKGISVSLSDFALADATTRTAYADVDGGMRVTWAAGDTIGIFPDVGGQVEFPIQEGTASNQAVFDGGGWALKSNSTYAAYYPFSKWNVFRDNETISLVYTGQTQTDNGSSAHLGKYDYQATGGVKTNESGYLNFQFKHLGALMAFNLTVPKAGTYTSLTLTSSEDIFVTKAELDISGQTPVLKPTETSKTFTLSLDDIELTSDNAELTAYMMLAPVDLSQGSLELTIDGDGIFTATLEGHDLEAGKQYTIEKSFAGDTPSPDQVIVFADDEVKAICVANWDTNGDGELSYEEATAVTDLGGWFIARTRIKSFDEFRYFTGVTLIGKDAFSSCESLTSIEIPVSVTSISDGAFSGCESLTSIEIPASVTSIGGNYPFAGCSSLTSIVVDNDNDYYDSRNSCNAIIETRSNTLIGGCASTIIPASVTSIGNFAFTGCSSLTSIEIPDGVTSIGHLAFSHCTNLTDIEIPDGVTSIGARAFYNCSNLTSIKMPDGVTSIGVRAFEGCSNLTSIKIPNNVTSIGEYTFLNCSNLTSIVIPDGVSMIGNGAFEGCSNLTSIKIPNNVASIGEYTFLNCSNLTSIVIPDGVSMIGNSAFEGCSSLTSIVIPDGVTTIGGSAFLGCESLTSITCLSINPPSVGFNAFHRTSITAIYVPAASVNAYKTATGWSEYANKIEALAPAGNIVFADENVKAICIANWDTNKDGELSYAEAAAVTDIGCYFDYDYVKSFDELQYFTGVTTIGGYAFYDCSNLTSIVIPDGVTTIGEYAFYNCSSLTSIEIPEGVTYIGEYAFYNCSSLNSIKLPDSMTLIGASAFSGCSSLTTMKIPEGIKRINFLGGCSSLTSILIPEGVTDINFSGCSGLTSISIPESVTSIGNNAFYDCKNLTSIEIPDGVTSIGEKAFYNCQSLTSIEIPEGVTYIGEEAFQYCNSLTSIVIPDGVSMIGNSAFEGCSSLTSIVIPDGVTSIGNYAFYGCRSLVSIELPYDVVSIGNQAFRYCLSLTSITCQSANPPSVGSLSFDYTGITAIYVPAASVNAYKTATGWSDYADKIRAIPE